VLLVAALQVSRTAESAAAAAEGERNNIDAHS
jgi:hypothetical protein